MGLGVSIGWGGEVLIVARRGGFIRLKGADPDTNSIGSIRQSLECHAG